jgi:hypothetical protein
MGGPVDQGNDGHCLLWAVCRAYRYDLVATVALLISAIEPYRMR